jgi:hypothetical protein
MRNKPLFHKFIFKPAQWLARGMIFLCSLLSALSSFSQEGLDYETARSNLVNTLEARFIDKTFSQNIEEFYFTTCDSLINAHIVIEDRPIRDILLKLFVTCQDKLRSRSISILRIPALNNFFLQTIQLYPKQPINKLFRQIGITQTSILQSAFDGLALGDSITTFVNLRDMLNFPYLIANRIQETRYAKYKDTLLYFLANGAPDEFLRKLEEKDTFFTSLVNNSTNRTVKVVEQQNLDYFFERLLPFSLAISENRISKDEIIQLILSPPDYYHAMVEEIIRLHNDPDPQTSNYLQQPIAELNKEIAYIFFIDEINNLHELPEKTRFKSISSLPPIDLYFLLIAGGNQMYTSSFLYVFKRFLHEADKEGLEKFFDRIGYYQFDQFISNISVYGLVHELVHYLQEEKFAGLLIQYLDRLHNTQLSDNEIVLNGMTISEVLYEIRNYPKLNALLVTELEKPASQYDILLQRMNKGFLDILMDKRDYNTDQAYDVLSMDQLKKNGVIVQAWFFFDDEDACISFASGTALFNNKSWYKTDFGNYVVFSSRIGNKVKVYMNKPKSDVGYDEAQTEMLNAIREQGYEVTCYIHRGHSYHFYKSLSKMTSSARFVFLGSCGGYNEVLKIFQLNPNVHLIVSRHTGSRLINDQVLERITRAMVNNKDIKWDALWREFNARFRTIQEKDLFSSYIPPNKYTGVKFIRKVFNY